MRLRLESWETVGRVWVCEWGRQGWALDANPEVSKVLELLARAGTRL